MCIRKLKLLWHINERSCDEILVVLGRMSRLYVILSLLSLFYIYLAVKDNDIFEIAYECVLIMLFVGYVAFLRELTKGVLPQIAEGDRLSLTTIMSGDVKSNKHRLAPLRYSALMVFLIATMYAIKMIYYVVESFNYLDLVLSLISIFIQLSTLFVLVKLRSKIDAENSQLGDSSA